MLCLFQVASSALSKSRILPILSLVMEALLIGDGYGDGYGDGDDDGDGDCDGQSLQWLAIVG